ncbi:MULTISPECIES: 3'-5' exonuclease [unclassified Massilia]|uniref:3'-5' exonuclease n=1 Tax=unclassified Massilia TaxID=2609279 RepID=UPI00177C22DB|nr:MULTISPECIES: 3'-5' exonuclease [unclassified Massilia]MBD8532177.1 3'-5' exonuclease domain-containing protein 2 [Massilia sp. CFBP 13647]MBD8675565.1 3'-5' exonuclease domain-containing protein 2 [Massilia sp. CFBP 13721]
MSSVAEQEDLPPYNGIALADVVLVKSEAEAAAALAALTGTDVVGFDTESKPTFAKGEESTGPHLVQLATDSTAYLFQIGARPDPASVDLLRAVLEAPDILKVGFGLGDDLRRLRSKLGIETQNVVDLSTTLRRRGERNTLGAKTAVARFFGQRLAKSKRITTTNWALPRLSPQQIQYAADDAHVALKLYRHWRANPPT